MRDMFENTIKSMPDDHQNIRLAAVQGMPVTSLQTINKVADDTPGSNRYAS